MRKHRNHSSRKNVSAAVACATFAVGAVSCSDGSKDPISAVRPLGGAEVSASTLEDLRNGVVLPCRRSAPARVGRTERRRFAAVAFAYPQSAVSGSPRFVQRRLVMLNAEGDTLGVTECVVPNSRVGMRLSDAIFDGVRAHTTARVQRIARSSESTVYQLASTRAHPARRSGIDIGAPICLPSGECTILTAGSTAVALSGRRDPSPPSAPWFPQYCDPSEWSSFYGNPCDNSMGGSGGHGGTDGWNWDYVDGYPKDHDLDFYCDNSSSTCLRTLSEEERNAIQDAIGLFKDLQELYETDRVCYDAAYVAKLYFDTGRIFAGTDGPDSRGYRHLAESGTGRAPGATKDQTVIHLDEGFLSSARLPNVFVVGGTYPDIDYTIRDLANVLLHEGLHLYNAGRTYFHPDTEVAPFTSNGFSAVNPQTYTTPTSTRCLR
jgi:hypothetical protein